MNKGFIKIQYSAFTCARFGCSPESAAAALSARVAAREPPPSLRRCRASRRAALQQRRSSFGFREIQTVHGKFFAAKDYPMTSSCAKGRGFISRRPRATGPAILLGLLLELIPGVENLGKTMVFPTHGREHHGLTAETACETVIGVT